MKYLLALVLAFASFGTPRDADAHLATFGSWEITREYLGELFPEATDFLSRDVTYTDAQVAAIEKELGFSLYPEDKTPTFYIAVQNVGGKRKLLGVAIFIDPRLQPKVIGGSVLRLEVGIAVNSKGQIHKIRVFDYRGNLALTRPAFLDQFNGMKLDDKFVIGPKIKAVDGEAEESQLVANAAREALYLMKVSLGKGAQK
ncbi:hypothetical protein FRD01_00225 [Microvenator marinus]|uniref:FMN-binding domain-containing protein n=1 Tax=Microvenator marinus TaxID=2600177 RepID=A0A5B8XJM8_9DELT|nr:hypothetical protein [Microvenator marinus]QED25714.1 hypothetical protein FRD01_00225 [Microvenator marinus]